MARSPTFPLRAVVLFGLLAAPFVLTSCDLASAGNTLSLNADSEVPPVVDHRFSYSQEDVTEGGEVEVTSMIEDDLGEILTTNGVASRRQIVSAQVDSVRIKRVSAPALTGATFHFGTDAGGPRIAQVQFASGSGSEVDRTTRAVTGAVKQGEDQIFAQFSVDDPSNIPSGGSVVRATVYYRIEAE